MMRTQTKKSQTATTRFQSFEEREAAFNAAVGHLIPGRYRGPHRFWRDLSRVTDGLPRDGVCLPAYITSNPRDCLAFATADQVLAAAAMGQERGMTPDEAALQFGLKHAARQPIRSLSGGETVRLALAKVMLAAGGARELVIASPFCWLSRHHLPLLEKVQNCYTEMGKSVQIMAMDGEDSLEPMDLAWLESANLAVLPFDLEFAELKVQLGMPVNALTAKPVLAGVVDFHQTLASPCLVTGDNGQGKSVLAKALCGAAVTRGFARTACGGVSGRARLLFQDVVTQTLLRTPARMVKNHGGGRDGEAAVLCKALLADVARFLRHRGRPAEKAGQDEATLLEVKAALVAVRLAGRPGALILDEPDWGFARSTAIAFVLAVACQCHRRGVPVLLISHKPWWRPMAGSLLSVRKTAAQDQADLFGIVASARRELTDLPGINVTRNHF